MCVPSQHPRLFVFSGGHDGLRQHAQCEDPHLRLQQARPGCLLGRGDRAHPNLAFMCEYTSEPTRSVALYNCDYFPHYDLLTPMAWTRGWPWRAATTSGPAPWPPRPPCSAALLRRQFCLPTQSTLTSHSGALPLSPNKKEQLLQVKFQKPC